MNVALMGKGKLAMQIAEWFLSSNQHHLIGVVPVLPEPKWTQSLLAWCQQVKVPVYHKHTDLPSGLDLVFSCFYDKILRKKFIDQHKRVLNLHNSPLPKYRGVNPINWALKNGESYHGVTIHEIDEGIDTGPIVAQVRYSIYPEIEEVRDVYHKSLDYGWTLFKSIAPLLDKIQAVKQNDVEACYYSDKDRHLLGDRASWTRFEKEKSPINPLCQVDMDPGRSSLAAPTG
jgi:methionyl-tRNA formyltransferase